MKMRVVKSVIVYTTPAELREWAEKLETVFAAALIGETMRLRIYDDDDLSLSLGVDQVRIREAGK